LAYSDRIASAGRAPITATRRLRKVREAGARPTRGRTCRRRSSGPGPR